MDEATVDTLTRPQTEVFVAKASGRFWEVDVLRGVAVVMMVIYHFVHDLYYFRVTDVIFTNPFWFYFQRTTATLFIALVGISLALRQGQVGGHLSYLPLAKRGLQLGDHYVSGATKPIELKSLHGAWPDTSNQTSPSARYPASGVDLAPVF